MTDKLGDKHNGKFVTTALVNEKYCIKKPRPADIEQAYNAFLLNLEEEGFLYIPGKVEVIKATNHYHYVAITEHKELSAPIEISLYYKRVGALLFLSYIFSSVDLHRENLIAQGDSPTIIDYETLLTGDDSRIPDTNPVLLLSNSVWASYLLPRWKQHNNTEMDTSGLNGHILNNKGICEFEDNPNLPYYRGAPVFAYDYENDILEGFNYSYNFFMKNSRKIEKWLNVFTNCSFRVILRQTDIYNKLIAFLNEFPENQKAIEATALLERAYLNDIDQFRLSKLKNVLKEEVRAVTNGEIPLFTVKGDGIAICCRNEILYEHFFLYSPVERVKQKLKSLSVENRDGQMKIISQSLASAKPLKFSKKKENNSGTIEIHQISDNRNKTKKFELPSACFQLFEELENNRIEGMPDGWLYLNRGYDGSATLTGIGPGLYHGMTGILCFYAALFSKTKDERFHNLLKRHYRNIRSHLLEEKIIMDSSASSLNIGIAGILLALHHISDLTGDLEFTDDADIIFENVMVPKYLTKGNTDVLCGYAGLPLTLHKLRNREKARKIAKILRPTLRNIKPSLTGIAHGASGYALVLAILDYILEDHSSNDTILKLLKWEDNYFDEQMLNWIDLRYGKQKHLFMNGWCCGTPGIVMARYEILRYLDDHRIQEICQRDLETLHKWLVKGILNDHDNLCCGTAARVMVASRLGVKSEKSYLRLLSSVESNTLHLQHLLRTNDFIPGLMQGLAGIGYALVMHGDNRSGGMLV